MKKSLILVSAFLLIAGAAQAAILAADNFDYPDGSLVAANPGWINHSGGALPEGLLMVVGGQAFVKHGAPDEDVHMNFAPTTGGAVIMAMDITVEDMGAPISGTDSEYFVHFGLEGTYTYIGRTDIVPPSGAGDFSVGIATTSSTAEATWPMDLYFGVTYRLVVAYDQEVGLCHLWIDPVDAESAFISSTTAVTGYEVNDVNLRQSDSTNNEGIYVDNLIVANACEDIFAACPTVGVDEVSWDSLKSLYR